ncbi:MAG: helix-turn-helix domain-containing protein [Candidatus Sulfotelmatobacter sp.]
MVVFLRRPGGQSQFSATLAAQRQDHRSWGALLAWIADNITRDLSIDILARRAAMSPRNFARLFTQEIGKTPGTHVEDLRLEAARRQLESTAASLEEVAKFSGFKSAEVLRRVFARRLGTTPGQYRNSFGQESRGLSNRHQKSSLAPWITPEKRPSRQQPITDDKAGFREVTVFSNCAFGSPHLR